MSEIAAATGIAKESIRQHLFRLEAEGIIIASGKKKPYRFFLKNPEKFTNKEKRPKLSDLKPSLSKEGKKFIDKLCCLYLSYGDLNTVAKKMKIDKSELLERVDRLIHGGYLYPIKNRRGLILTLRIKRTFDKIGRPDETAKKFGFSNTAISKYLWHGNDAGLFKHGDSSSAKKYNPRKIPKKQDLCSKKNVETMLRLEREYRKAHSIKKVAIIHGISHEKVRQFLAMGNDLGLFEFPPKIKKLYMSVSKEKMRDDFLSYQSIPKLSKLYRVSSEQVKEALNKHGISIANIMFEIRRKRALDSYRNLVKELGHHPSTTEIKKRKVYLVRAIKKYWGSIYSFRAANGFPDPKIGPK